MGIGAWCPEERGWAKVQRSYTDSEAFVHEPRSLTEVQCQRLIDYWAVRGWRTRKWERLMEGFSNAE